MGRVFRVFIVLTVLILAFAVPAAAAPELPIRGTVMGEHGPPDFSKPGCPDWAVWRYSSHGVGHMSHLGRVEYTLSQCTVPVGEVDNYSEGTIELVAANGDKLYLEHTMDSRLVFGDSGPPLGFTLMSTWEAVGGTGRFAHATGHGTFDGVGDIPGGGAQFGIPDGIAQFNFTGTISYDASDRSK